MARKSYVIVIMAISLPVLLFHMLSSARPPSEMTHIIQEKWHAADTVPPSPSLTAIRNEQFASLKVTDEDVQRALDTLSNWPSKHDAVRAGDALAWIETFQIAARSLGAIDAEELRSELIVSAEHILEEERWIRFIQKIMVPIAMEWNPATGDAWSTTLSDQRRIRAAIQDCIVHIKAAFQADAERTHLQEAVLLTRMELPLLKQRRIVLANRILEDVFGLEGGTTEEFHADLVQLLEQFR